MWLLVVVVEFVVFVVDIDAVGEIEEAGMDKVGGSLVEVGSVVEAAVVVCPVTNVILRIIPKRQRNNSSRDSILGE